MRLVFTATLAVLVAAAAAAQLSPDRAQEAQRQYRAGLELMSAERWDEAAEKFKGAVAIDPLMAMAHYNLGQCRMHTRRYAEAVTAFQDCRTAFERLSSVSQDEREARERHRRDEINELKDDLNRVKYLKGAGDTHASETAIAMRMEERLRQLESMQHKDRAGESMVPAGVYVALGSAYFRQGALAEAERDYRQAVQIDPNLGAAHNNLAVIYLMSGRIDEAEASMKLAEKNGFRVSPAFKEDVKAARSRMSR
jgi:tetratricopeptide (TPR) repeat protein